ncbi:MAG: phosphoribosylamine--glycine ligase [Candidatus Kapabacteria bacterium]|nr:phosphoribosylamine--glycine ligase [Candidatus Kapabacteria bacterium]
MQEHILLIGSGGREHALAVALRRSASCANLWCAPGNPGIAAVAECVALDLTDHAAVVEWCRNHAVTLVVVGPEVPLRAGMADDLRVAGIDVFGPSKAAAQIETSKGFAKDLMARNGIPTAPYRRFGADEHAAASAYVAQHALPVVIKYDGLAAGKGVVVAMSTSEAQAALDDMYVGAFGADGVVVEGFLEGQEASLFAVCDGKNYTVLAPAQDHKRVGDGDTGKNTGGMGAYAPAPLVTADVLQWADEHILRPTIAALAADGMPFVGCLYAGLMVHADGTSSVVEFNCRFGDPETQAVMAVFDGDLARLFASAARGVIDTDAIVSVANGHAVNVVLASRGYPDAFEKGVEIRGIERAMQDTRITVFHAGTASTANGQLVTAGGRVLGVTAKGVTLDEARRAAYAACDVIEFSTKYLRTDIAMKGLA